MSALENDERTISDGIEMMRHGRPLAPRSRSIRTYANGRISTGAREVYSYGRHFPLFHHVPRNGRTPELFVINGDEWRGSASRTRDHQEITRRLIGATGVRAVVIPFSALAGAGIELDSIRPVDVREDKTWTETLYADRLEDMPRHEQTTGAYQDFTAASLDDVPPARRVGSWGPGGYTEYAPDENGAYHWREWITAPRTPDSDGRYSWTVTRHRLGDCLFSAVRAGKRARFLSSFDYQEPRPMYFLVQVPRGAGDTVEQAVDSLAPRAVWAARARGRRVERQGDIFFIETALTEIDLYARGVTRRARLTQFDRDARARKGEVGFVHETAKEKTARVRRFHAFRRAEFRRIHAEFQTSTVERYLDNPSRSVKFRPESRTYRRDHAAMVSRRIRVWNGPDAAYLTDGNRARAAWSRAHELALAKYGAPDERAPLDYRARVRAALAVYGTAHTAREVVTVKGGAVYVRGKVSHRPGLVDAGRDSRAEHVPLQLPADTWFLAIRNRVPRARA